MEKIYITENIEFYQGQQAEEFLKTNNDSKFFNEKDGGVHKVPTERWKVAQNYERKTWMESNLNATDDRNNEHFQRFESYEIIDDLLKSKKSIIELGCGPFTNLRLILPKLEVDRIDLVDPLINDYLTHPNCFYKNKTINGLQVNTINSPIEELSLDSTFDIILMINVLEHCYDIEKIFENILSMLKEDGIFIFSDVYFKDVDELLKNAYDAGHPIKISETKINNFLENFEILYEKRFHGLYSQSWRNDLYFIGKK